MTAESSGVSFILLRHVQDPSQLQHADLNYLVRVAVARFFQRDLVVYRGPTVCPHYPE